MQNIRNLILDMDGVLWHGNTPVPNLVSFFNIVHGAGIRTIFATNNASKTPLEYVEKFGNFGVTITADQVMSSALATAEYLARHYRPEESTVYVLGGNGLRTALSEKGFNILERGDYQSEARLVVVGFNQESCYEDFAVATIHIRQHAAVFIGCNPDVTFPSERGLVPGNGSLLALLQAATDVEPLIIGKPFPTMFQECLNKLGEEANGDNTAMVGDRLNTDIAGGINVGIQTILLFSGITQPSDLAASSVRPDYVFDDITALGQHILQLNT